MSNSVFYVADDAGSMTVTEMVEDRVFIPQAIRDGVQGKFLEELIFRKGSPSKGVVAYNESASPYLSQAAGTVAEFAEIPVAEPIKGVQKSIVGEKQALGIEISEEMRQWNSVDEVDKRVTALVRTMVRDSHMAVWSALSSSSIPELASPTDWSKSSGKPLDDLMRAVEQAVSAKSDNGDQLGFNPDTLLISRTDLTRLNRSPDVQGIYRGDVAHDNPLYKGLEASPIPGINVAVSSFIPAGKAFLVEAGTLGFYSDCLPFTITRLYEKGGQSGLGGPSMTWRCDAIRQRILAVDTPLAGVKINTTAKA